MSQLFEDTVKHIEQRYADQDAVDGTHFYLLRDDGTFVVVPMVLGSDAEKPMFLQMLRAMAIAMNIREYVVVTECWMTMVSSKEQLLVKPSESPDRMEAVIISHVRRGVGQQTRIYELMRHEGRMSLCRNTAQEDNAVIGGVMFEVLEFPDPPEEIRRMAWEFVSHFNPSLHVMKDGELRQVGIDALQNEAPPGMKLH